MRRKSRDLSADELALWQYVTRDVKRRYRRSNTDIVTDKALVGSKISCLKKRAAAPAPATTRSSDRALVLGVSDNLDRRTAQRFARGQMKIDARIDLHGMTVAQAGLALSRFIREASTTGRRCVLVVTGKGKVPRDNVFDTSHRGRIRAETPFWLNRPSLRPLILAIREAHARDGGSGALYVLLKLNRAG